MSAATVLPAPGRFSTTNCWPKASPHFDASMRARVSGLPPGASPTRTRTGFCGQAGACASAGPCHAEAKRASRIAKRFMTQGISSDFTVYAQQVRDRFRRPAPEAALGGDAEVARVFRRDGDARSRNLEAVGVVHQPEEELRPAMQFQLAKRSEIGFVAAIRGHRHMNVGKGPVERLDEPVVDFHHFRGAPRLLPVAAALTSSAPMHAPLYVPWAPVAKQRHAIRNSRPHIS